MKTVLIKVLLIEDNPEDSRLIGEMLSRVEGARFDLKAIDRLSAGLECLDSEKIDVILLDLNLPDSQGLDTLEKVHSSVPNVPIIVLTGVDDVAVSVKAVRKVAQDYLVKGQFESRLLARCIRYAMERQWIMEDLEKAKQALMLNETHFRSIIEKNADGIIITDKKGLVHFVNPAAEKLFGRKVEELVGNFFGFPVVAGEKTELDLIRKDGKRTVAEMRVVESELKEGKAYLASLRDITERKQAEERQELSFQILEKLNRPKSSHDEIREILELVKAFTGFEAIGIRLLDGEDFPYFVSKGFPSDFIQTENYLCASDKAGEIIRDSDGNPYLECMCGNILCERIDPALPFFTKGGSFWTNGTTKLLASTIEKERQTRIRNSCNSAGYESVALIPLRSEETIIGLLQFNDSRPDCFTLEMIQFFEGLGTIIGIALDQKRTQEVLNRERHFLDRIMETSPAGITMVDREGRITFANARAEEVLGLDREEITSRTYNDPKWKITDYQGNPFPDDKLPFHMVTSAGQPVYDVRYAIEWSDGRRVLLSINSTPMFDSSGVLTGMVSTVEDITKRVLMEEQVKGSEKKYRELYDNAPVGYHELDREGKIVRANRTEADMLGYRPEEIIGRPVSDFIAPEDRQKSRASFKLKISGRKKIKPFERKYVCKNGKTIDCHIEENLICDDRGRINGMRTTVQDISDRKRSEELRIRLETALEQAAEAIVITDTTGKIQYVNPAFQRITGYARDQVLGENPRFLKSGKQDSEFYKNLWDTITRGEVWKGRFINKKKDGTIYHEEATISPVHDSSGKIINFVAVMRDISEKLELENQLRHVQKMESIGLLAGGVAHDFNNLLTSIMGYSSLIKKAVDLPEKQRKRIEEVEKASQRGAEITRQLLTFSRKQPAKLTIMNPNDAVNQTLRFLKRGFGPNITIDARLDKALGNVNADSTQIQQVLMNLCLNARDAMPDGGKILVETSNIEIDNENAAKYMYAKTGPYVLSSLSDTGTGMTKETLSRIFEPFFTTKETGKGTGLGLSIVYGIVKTHGGFINVYSEPGKGSTFKVYLPRAAGEKKMETAAEHLIKGGEETILIVDDEEMILNLAASVLEEYGYNCLTAENGFKALNIYRQKHQNIDLVLLDIVMHKMSGQELFQEMLKINPHVRAVMSSGFSVQDEETFYKQGVKAFVPKPYQEKRLAKTVREVLDREN